MSRSAYLTLLGSGELERRAAEAVAALKDCTVCPRDCHVDRLQDKRMFCATGRRARVASHFPHFGEEDCLRGRKGSGTIFFSWCNLRCVFCQNGDISQRPDGDEVDARGLAEMMLELQARGCHNINFVTPEHVVPQIIEALAIAVDSGLRVPIVYNTSAYDALESIELMDGIADIYMPDFKFWSASRSKVYMKAEDYPEAARQAIVAMHRQVGDLVIGEDGLARRGILIRHLVMPGMLDETRAILEWIAAELGTNTYINLMDQYRPAGKVGGTDYVEINRRTFSSEFLEAKRIAWSLGFHRLDDGR